MKSITNIPARAPAAAGGGGGSVNAKGQATRRADGWANTDMPAFGGLPKAAQKSDPQGSASVEYGPSSGAWSKSGRATTKPKG
jgi:hypothetical protein